MADSPNVPTVILVHGGFADASYWAPVIRDLQKHDVPVLAPPNPLRGLAQTPNTSRATSISWTGRCCWSAIPTEAR